MFFDSTSPIKSPISEVKAMPSMLSAYLGPPDTSRFERPTGDQIREAVAQGPKALFELIISTIVSAPPHRYNEACIAVKGILHHPACYVPNQSHISMIDPQFDCYIATIRDPEFIGMILKYKIYHYWHVRNFLETMLIAPLTPRPLTPN